MTPAVLFIVFNRPATTSAVFARIRQARPSRLYVCADGPRPGREGEAERCAEVRRIATSVDWPCEVRTLFRDTNLGCRHAVSSGIDWFFAQEPEGIILEDDCLPEPTFFGYCAELLERYRDDERIMTISGDNFQPPSHTIPYSYYFSRFAHVWGWASWRRVWQHYDVDVRLWPLVRETGLLEEMAGGRRAARRWRRVFDAVHAGRIDTWDYQLTFACWAQGGLTVIPGVNLISNIGFGADATHTATASPLAELPTRPVELPLRHPPVVVRDHAADAHTEAIFGVPPFRTRVSRRIRRALSRGGGGR